LIESRGTRQFWRLFAALPEDARLAAQSAYRTFRSNPAHPGIQFKRLEGHDDVYSVRIGLGYRALGVMRKGRIVWYWIGTHADYNRLV